MLCRQDAKADHDKVTTFRVLIEHYVLVSACYLLFVKYKLKYNKIFSWDG